MMEVMKVFLKGEQKIFAYFYDACLPIIECLCKSGWKT